MLLVELLTRLLHIVLQKQSKQLHTEEICLLSEVTCNQYYYCFSYLSSDSSSPCIIDQSETSFQNLTLKQEQNYNYCFNVNVLVIIIDNNVLYVCIMHLNPVIYSDSSNHNLGKRPEIINFHETINQRNGYLAT